MIKKIIIKALTWLVQNVDIDVIKENDLLIVTVELNGLVLFSKKIPLRRVS